MHRRIQMFARRFFRLQFPIVHWILEPLSPPPAVRIYNGREDGEPEAPDNAR